MEWHHSWCVYHTGQFNPLRHPYIQQVDLFGSNIRSRVLFWSVGKWWWATKGSQFISFTKMTCIYLKSMGSLTFNSTMTTDSVWLNTASVRTCLLIVSCHVRQQGPNQACDEMTGFAIIKREIWFPFQPYFFLHSFKMFSYRNIAFFSLKGNWSQNLLECKQEPMIR